MRTALLLLALLVVPAAQAQYFITETFPNPPGGDDEDATYIELRGPAGGTLPANTYVGSLEADTNAPGTLDKLLDVSGVSFGSNGYLVLVNATSTVAVDANATTAPVFEDLENPSFSLLLFTAPTTPTTGTDYDTDDNGELDGDAAAWTVYDAVAVLDNTSDCAYAPVVFMPQSDTYTGTCAQAGAEFAAFANAEGGGNEPEWTGRREGSTGTSVSDWAAGFFVNDDLSEVLEDGAFPAGAAGQDATSPGSTNAPLPVELTAFTATASGSDALLAWTTASETGNTGFEVQMDAGTGFARAGWVEGAGTTLEAQTYAFPVRGLAAGSYRFRLKQIDLDGAHDFSPVVELTVGLDRAYSLSAGPNPFRDATSLRLQVEAGQRVTVEAFDLLGRSVARLFDGEMAAGEAQTFAIDGAALAPGVYFVRAQGETFAASRRVVRLR